MAEKDVVEKTLESYNDVFADIINVLIFKGKRKINPDDLINATARSQYKLGSKIRDQERDVAKYWGNCKLHMALYGIENQTNVDKDMPLRCFGYDGAAYRHQLTEFEEYTDEEGNVHKKDVPRYPVITLVLYFGSGEWDKYKYLHETMEIDEDLREYVNDYKINVVSISKLDRATVDMFTSDFKIVADYFWQLENNGNYDPSPQEIEHVYEICQLMSLLTGDDRFDDAAEKILNAEKGKGSMCKVFDDAEARGEARGEDRINKLNSLLKEAGRIDDLLKACTDKVFQKKLMAEFASQLAV